MQHIGDPQPDDLDALADALTAPNVLAAAEVLAGIDVEALLRVALLAAIVLDDRRGQRLAVVLRAAAEIERLDALWRLPSVEPDQ